MTWWFFIELCLFDNQVQEIYHGLVAFCSELKKMEGEIDTERLDSSELKKRLRQAQNNLQSKRQSLQILRESLNTAPLEKKKYVTNNPSVNPSNYSIVKNRKKK